MENKRSIPKEAWFILISVWMIQFFCQIETFGYGVMMQGIMADTGTAYATMGNIAGVGGWLTVILTIPISIIAVRLNPKFSISIVAIITAIGMYIYGHASSISMLYLGKVLTHCLQQVLATVLVTLKVRGVPGERITEINGIENFIGPLGQTLATLILASILFAIGGWRNVYTYCAIGVIIFGIVHFFAYGNGKGLIYAPASPSKNANGGKESLGLKETWSKKEVWAVSIAWPGLTIAWMAMYYYWPSYATNYLGMSLGQTGIVIAMIPIFSAIGSLTAPIVSKKIGRDKPIIIVGAFLLAVSYFLMMKITNYGGLIIVAAVAGYMGYVIVPPAFSIVYKIGLSQKGTSLAYSTIMTFLSIGSAIAGTVIGALIGATDLQNGLTIASVTPLWFVVIGLIFFPELGSKRMAELMGKTQS